MPWNQREKASILENRFVESTGAYAFIDLKNTVCYRKKEKTIGGQSFMGQGEARSEFHNLSLETRITLIHCILVSEQLFFSFFW